MPMPIILMLIKFWFCCLFISRKRKEKREIFTITLPAFSTSRLPSLTCVFFSFPTHTLLFFLPITLPSHSPTIIPPLSLQLTFSPSLSLPNTFLLLSLPTRILRLSPTHFPLLTLSHSHSPTAPLQLRWRRV